MATRTNKTMHTLTVYVTFSIAVVIVYSIAEFLLSLITGVAHDTLTGCVYAFFGGEVVTCGLIKIFKLKGVRNE